MAEHQTCNLGVEGSSPSASTTNFVGAELPRRCILEGDAFQKVRRVHPSQSFSQNTNALPVQSRAHRPPSWPLRPRGEGVFIFEELNNYSACLKSLTRAGRKIKNRPAYPALLEFFITHSIIIIESSRVTRKTKRAGRGRFLILQPSLGLYQSIIS